MQFQELVTITDKLFYADSSSYKVISSKQKELLQIIKPTLNIKKIDYKIINQYIEYLKEQGNSNATINAKTAYLSKLLTYAYSNGLILNKPYIPYFKVIQQKEKYLSQDEIIKMLKWTKTNKEKELQKIILIGLYTGLRINNILSLTTDNVQKNVLYIYDPKTNKNFILPLSKKIKYIFIDFKGFNIDYNQCYYIFNKMKKELNLDKQITIHTLRHTFCSNLIQKGIPITTIQKLANHKKIQTTMRYSHLSNKELEAAIDVL